MTQLKAEYSVPNTVIDAPIKAYWWRVVDWSTLGGEYKFTLMEILIERCDFRFWLRIYYRCSPKILSNC